MLLILTWIGREYHGASDVGPQGVNDRQSAGQGGASARWVDDGRGRGRDREDHQEQR